jgi:hypothetical protein
MKKVIDFLNKYGIAMMTPLVLVMFLKTCSTNGRIERVSDDVKMTTDKLDSLHNQMVNEIKIEGLKSEKRMIQSTDRKIMDVNRQSQIDREIENLEK